MPHAHLDDLEAKVAGGRGDEAVHAPELERQGQRDLAPEQVQALITNWLPTAKANAKPTADDKRLIAALDSWAAANLQPVEEDNLTY